MKKLDAPTLEHVKSEVTTLCRCWIIELTNSERLGFTDHDQDLVIDGVVCERDSGAESSSVEERTGLNIDEAEIAGALQSDRITPEDIKAGKYDGGKVTTYFVNWQEQTQYFIDQVSLIGQIVQEDGAFKFELQSITSTLDHTSGRHFIKRCQADLGDSKCKVSIDDAVYRGAGVVEEVQSSHSIVVSGLSGFESNWFSFGHLHWTDSANAEHSIEIASHTADENRVRLKLWQAMPRSIQVGDAFTINAGCDKTFATCKSKFSNSKNFQGFPHMPGDGFALSRAGEGDQFDGGPIIP